MGQSGPGTKAKDLSGRPGFATPTKMAIGAIGALKRATPTKAARMLLTGGGGGNGAGGNGGGGGDKQGLKQNIIPDNGTIHPLAAYLMQCVASPLPLDLTSSLSLFLPLFR